MRIIFDYPLATEENMKTIQDAINFGKDQSELVEMFGENMVWDCIAVLSGNKDTPWALLEHMDGHEQIGYEDWQSEVVEKYLAQCEILQSSKIPADMAKAAIKVQNRVLLIQDFTEGWDYYLLDDNGHIVDEGGVIDVLDAPLGETIKLLIKDYRYTRLPGWRNPDRRCRTWGPCPAGAC